MNTCTYCCLSIYPSVYFSFLSIYSMNLLHTKTVHKLGWHARFDSAPSFEPCRLLGTLRGVHCQYQPLQSLNTIPINRNLQETFPISISLSNWTRYSQYTVIIQIHSYIIICIHICTYIYIYTITSKLHAFSETSFLHSSLQLSCFVCYDSTSWRAGTVKWKKRLLELLSQLTILLWRPTGRKRQNRVAQAVRFRSRNKNLKSVP